MKYFKLISIILIAFIFIKCNVDNENILDCSKSNPCGETVTIGNQIWMTKNLDVDQYTNGDPIPEVQDSAQWVNLTTGAWCYYNNNPALGAIYGKLYNWYAVNDPRGLAPKGWHVPSDDEWKELEISLGMSQSEVDRGGGFRGIDEGGKLKEAGSVHWQIPNTGATNESCFSALPGGWRQDDGTFYYIGYHGLWWSSSEHDAMTAWHRHVYYEYANICRISTKKVIGFSVRCVRD